VKVNPVNHVGLEKDRQKRFNSTAKNVKQLHNIEAHGAAVVFVAVGI